MCVGDFFTLFALLQHTFSNLIFHLECERTIVSLLLEDILHPHVVYTAYSNICYLRLGPLGQRLLTSADPHVIVAFPIRQNRTNPASKNPKATLAIADDDGWISPNVKKAGGKGSKWQKSTRKAAAKPAKKPAKSKPTAKKAATKTVVEINLSSSESSDDEFLIARRNALKRKRRSNVIDDDSSIDEVD